MTTPPPPTAPEGGVMPTDIERCIEVAERVGRLSARSDETIAVITAAVVTNNIVAAIRALPPLAAQAEMEKK